MLQYLGIIFIVTIGLYVLAFAGLSLVSRKVDYGVRQFSRTAEELKLHVSKKVAPAPFYKKQRTFRLCYATIQVFDKLLLLTSLFYSALTAYLILDESVGSGYTVVCLVISTVSSTLKATLNLDKFSSVYIEAVRKIELAILRYEYSDESVMGYSDPKKCLFNKCQENPFEGLLRANEEAERMISIKNE